MEKPIELKKIANMRGQLRLDDLECGQLYLDLSLDGAYKGFILITEDLDKITISNGLREFFLNIFKANSEFSEFMGLYKMWKEST
ncbi:MAG: hypothetical protein GTO16_05080 [Candidatus Aminicenantes bacterium]|nr:hypothetical protein [Candidatus Aminicenantes bacterium]NIO18169.1 hypothetical protein [bacterium]